MATKRIKVLRNAPVTEKEIAKGEAPDGGARETENPASSTPAPSFESILRETIHPRHFVPPSITREVVIEYDPRDMAYTVRIPELRLMILGEEIDRIRHAPYRGSEHEVLVDHIVRYLREIVANSVARMPGL